MVTIEIKEFEEMSQERVADLIEALPLLKEIGLTENGTVVSVMVSPDLYDELMEGMS
jgi:hypothetical protein